MPAMILSESQSYHLFPKQRICFGSGYLQFIRLEVGIVFSLRLQKLFFGVLNDIREFQSVVILGIDYLKPYSKQKSEHTKRRKQQHGVGVIVFHRVGHSGVGCSEHLSNQNREQLRPMF